MGGWGAVYFGWVVLIIAWTVVCLCVCGDFPQCVKIWFGHELDLETEEILISGHSFFCSFTISVEIDQRVLGGHLYKNFPQKISAQRSFDFSQGINH